MPRYWNTLHRIRTSCIIVCYQRSARKTMSNSGALKKKRDCFEMLWICVLFSSIFLHPNVPFSYFPIPVVSGVSKMASNKRAYDNGICRLREDGHWWKMELFHQKRCWWIPVNKRFGGGGFAPDTIVYIGIHCFRHFPRVLQTMRTTSYNVVQPYCKKGWLSLILKSMHCCCNSKYYSTSANKSVKPDEIRPKNQ